MTERNTDYGITDLMELVHYLMLKIIKYKTLSIWERVSAYPQVENTLKPTPLGPIGTAVLSLFAWKLRRAYYVVYYLQNLIEYYLYRNCSITTGNRL
jgi:hypothetical protein